MVGSRRYNINKHKELINNYLKRGSTELGDLVLTGDELLDLVESIENYEEYVDKYSTIKGGYENLIENIEELFKDKKGGQIVDELRLLLKNAKEDLEKEE